MTQCLYSMPIIVLNMGSEMTYILAQRYNIYFILYINLIKFIYYKIIRTKNIQ